MYTSFNQLCPIPTIGVSGGTIFNMDRKVLPDGRSKFGPYKSSYLETVGYEPGTRELEAEFTDGAIYSYDNVPQQTYENMLAAPSKGQYFYNYIRKGYPYHKERDAYKRPPHLDHPRSWDL